jgi:glutamate synthase (NADH)
LIAEDIREIMAKLGFRKFNELVGRSDKLKVRQSGNLNFKEKSLNYEAILLDARQLRPGVSTQGGSTKQKFDLEKRLDQKVIELASDVLDGKSDSCTIELNITNDDRAFGATLSNKISLKYKDIGLRDDSIQIKLQGSAGQSFGAFLAPGVTLELCGDANDYVGKGLSGGKIVIYPPESSPFKSTDAIIVGNAVLYGAISGTLYLRGQAAERFCVRNSGAIAVSEGCGDHGCEYMTGGVAVILDLTGRNFAAGMSGGLAYIFDPTGVFPPKCNKESVGLYKVTEDDDLRFLKNILQDFFDKTRSQVAESILSNWPLSLASFIKVYPHEYKKVIDDAKKQKLLRRQLTSAGSVDVRDDQLGKTAIALDIEDSVKDLDKVKGFYKYERSSTHYRRVEERVKDWKEVYNHAEVKKHLKKQAARCMDCGIPFCQSKDGCPLGNIIPKWNDLVFQVILVDLI